MTIAIEEVFLKGIVLETFRWDAVVLRDNIVEDEMK